MNHESNESHEYEEKKFLDSENGILMPGEVIDRSPSLGCWSRRVGQTQGFLRPLDFLETHPPTRFSTF